MSLGKLMTPVNTSLSPALARRPVAPKRGGGGGGGSRLAAKRGEWRGGKAFPFSSQFPLASNVPRFISVCARRPSAKLDSTRLAPTHAARPSFCPGSPAALSPDARFVLPKSSSTRRDAYFSPICPHPSRPSLVWSRWAKIPQICEKRVLSELPTAKEALI